MKKDINKKYKGVTLRLVQIEDANRYYEENFTTVDEELNFFTGSNEVFSRQQIVDFITMSVATNTHYLFVMVNEEGNIIGETAINEFSEDGANFRIAIFQKQYRELGYGCWATKETCRYANEILHLKKFTLSVLTVNERAVHVYEKCGFKISKKTVNSIRIINRDYDEFEMKKEF